MELQEPKNLEKIIEMQRTELHSIREDQTKTKRYLDSLFDDEEKILLNIKKLRGKLNA